MIWWRGYGLIAFLIPLIGYAIAEVLTGVFNGGNFNDKDLIKNIFLIFLPIYSIVIWVIGSRLNKDWEGWNPPHSVYGIPLQYFAFIYIPYFLYLCAH